jgi:hypothetical protein
MGMSVLGTVPVQREPTPDPRAGLGLPALSNKEMRIAPVMEGMQESGMQSVGNR